MSMDEKKIIVGKINGVYGVKGWVKVFSDTEPREGILKYSPWYLQHPNVDAGRWREIKIEAGRRHTKTVVIKLKGYDDRDESMQLIGAQIAIDASQLKSLAKNEYYWRELIGLRVVNQQNIELGVVERLFETGANDVLVVKDEAQERLIPWTIGHAVLEIDIEQGVISVDWDEEF